MVFEVDNTTEQLIDKLQESVQETIDVLEEGQREIKDLIDEVRQSNTSLATSSQVDLVGEDISKVRTAIQKLASAEQLTQFDAKQEKILGLVEQEVQFTAELKSALPKMSNDIEQQTKTILDAQSDSESQLEAALTKILVNETETRIAQLQAIAVNLDTLSKYIDAQMVKLSSEAGDALTVAKNNRDILAAIADYLSLPGYKRFFKGMEVPRSEAAQ